MLKYLERRRVRKKVRAGAQVLDQQCSGWEKKIKLDCLYLESHTSCVLGQLFGTYSCGLVELRLNGRQAINFGFMIRNRRCSFNTLTDEWKREINRRLALVA